MENQLSNVRASIESLPPPSPPSSPFIQTDHATERSMRASQLPISLKHTTQTVRSIPDVTYLTSRPTVTTINDRKNVPNTVSQRTLHRNSMHVVQPSKVTNVSLLQYPTSKLLNKDSHKIQIHSTHSSAIAVSTPSMHSQSAAPEHTLASTSSQSAALEHTVSTVSENSRIDSKKQVSQFNNEKHINRQHQGSAMNVSTRLSNCKNKSPLRDTQPFHVSNHSSTDHLTNSDNESVQSMKQVDIVSYERQLLRQNNDYQDAPDDEIIALLLACGLSRSFNGTVQIDTCDNLSDPTSSMQRATTFARANRNEISSMCREYDQTHIVCDTGTVVDGMSNNVNSGRHDFNQYFLDAVHNELISRRHCDWSTILAQLSTTSRNVGTVSKSFKVKDPYHTQSGYASKNDNASNTNRPIKSSSYHFHSNLMADQTAEKISQHTRTSSTVDRNDPMRAITASGMKNEYESPYAQSNLGTSNSIRKLHFRTTPMHRK